MDFLDFIQFLRLFSFYKTKMGSEGMWTHDTSRYRVENLMIVFFWLGCLFFLVFSCFILVWVVECYWKAFLLCGCLIVNSPIVLCFTSRFVEICFSNFFFHPLTRNEQEEEKRPRDCIASVLFLLFYRVYSL